MQQTILFSALVLVVFAASGQGIPPRSNKVQTEMSDVASGKQTYREYCASCHGEDGKGMGPAASALRAPPSDLTTLAKRHGGSFPEEYVTEILRFGKPIQVHGSSDMPIWGPIFGARDKFNEVAVRQRIKNLCAYLASLQEKES
jgi:mono/diheme cytochrome c family protein